jgi:hypothetical protein
MRAIEFIVENYEDKLSNALMRALIWAKSFGLKQVKTSRLVKKIESEGFSLTSESLVPLLNTTRYKNLISVATPDIIQFNMGDIEPDDSKENAQKVQDMAISAAKKVVNNG